MDEDELSFSKSLLWILVSTLLVSGGALMGWHYYLHVKEKRFNDPQYHVVAILQSTTHHDALKTSYLAELLGLSLDRPTNIYQLETKKTENILLSNPLIKKASVRKIFPGTLLINYRMHTPAAYIGDFSNTVVDKDGFLFPFKPYFTPKRLPIFYLGLEKENLAWGMILPERTHLNIAFDVLHSFHHFVLDRFFVKQIDLSQLEAASYGERQVVVILEERPTDFFHENVNQREVFLRLNPNHYRQDIANFRILFEAMANRQQVEWKNEGPLLVDFRIAHLAFVKQY